MSAVVLLLIVFESGFFHYETVLVVTDQSDLPFTVSVVFAVAKLILPDQRNAVSLPFYDKFSFKGDPSVAVKQSSCPDVSKFGLKLFWRAKYKRRLVWAFARGRQRYVPSHSQEVERMLRDTPVF